MLLSDRRHRLIFLCLAGMEMAWFAPFLLLILRARMLWRAGSEPPQIAPLLLFGLLWAGVLLFMLTIDILEDLAIDSPLHEAILLGLVVLTSFLSIRLLLYGRAALYDLRWLTNAFDALFNFQRGLRPELAFFVVSLFLWQRAANATSRELSFFSVGLSFRLGILLLIVGGGLLAAGLDPPADALPFLWLYFLLGLSAVALTRIDDRAMSARESSGALLPAPRLVQLLAVVAVTVTGTAALSRFYNPAAFLDALRWSAPLWRLIGRILTWIVEAVFRLLGPLLDWLEGLLRRLFSNSNIGQTIDTILQNIRQPPVNQNDLPGPTGIPVPPWVWTVMRYGFVLLVLALLLGLIFLFLARVRGRAAADEGELAGSEALTLGGGSLRRGLARLRTLAGLVRRYGLSSQLLAAISVQNIYANILRLARQRGFPRPPAQPPDEYLPRLVLAFPLQDARLARITDAYMRVHYGDHPVTDVELAQVRADYHAIQEISPPAHDEFA